MKKRIRNFRVYAEMECSAFILTPQAVRAPKPSSDRLGGCITRCLARLRRPQAAKSRGATQRSGCNAKRKNGEADTELPPLRGESAVERARSDVGYHIFGWNCSTKRKLFLKSVQNPGFSAKLSKKKRRTSLHNNKIRPRLMLPGETAKLYLDNDRASCYPNCTNTVNTVNTLSRKRR